jgi:FKBP-type peptidyl-prolyl cis-trans isomerase
MGIDVTKDALVIKIGAITLSIDFKTGAIKASGGGADVKYDRSTKTIKIGAAGTSMEFKKDGTGKLTISSGVYSGAVTFNTTNSNNQGRVEKFELNAKTKWLPASLVITPNWIVGGMNPTAVGTVTMKPFGSLTEGYKFEREYSVNLSTPLDFSDATAIKGVSIAFFSTPKKLNHATSSTH